MNWNNYCITDKVVHFQITFSSLSQGLINNTSNSKSKNIHAPRPILQHEELK